MDWWGVLIIYLAGVLTGICVVAFFLTIYCIDTKIMGENYGEGKDN